MSGYSLNQARLPDGSDKRSLLQAIDLSRSALPLRSVLCDQWLFLTTLDTVRSVEKRVAFYLQEHNTRLPHSAFRGQTPDEMDFGTGGSVPTEREAARQKAREVRAEANRKRTCSACEPRTVSLTEIGCGQGPEGSR